jgi:hypothetical protein
MNAQSYPGGKSSVLILTKYWLGYVVGEFFTNKTHPVTLFKVYLRKYQFGL